MGEAPSLNLILAVQFRYLQTCISPLSLTSVRDQAHCFQLEYEALSDPAQTGPGAPTSPFGPGVPSLPAEPGTPGTPGMPCDPQQAEEHFGLKTNIKWTLSKFK